MVQVLIVAKTEMGKGVCLGGLVLNTDQSVRLLPWDPSRFSHSMDTPFNLGDIWDLELEEVPNKNPPHTEDIRIKGFQERYIQTIPKSELKDFLLKRVDAPFVHPSALFDGLIRFTSYNPQTGGCKGYVDPADGLPGYSTGFWRFDQPLYKHEYEDGGAARYLYYDYGTGVLVLDVKHIGFDEPLEIIPPGSLLRFSLSRGHKDYPEEDRYRWLQLSGWFGSDQYGGHNPPRAITIPHTSL